MPKGIEKQQANDQTHDVARTPEPPTISGPVTSGGSEALAKAQGNVAANASTYDRVALFHAVHDKQANYAIRIASFDPAQAMADLAAGKAPAPPQEKAKSGGFFSRLFGSKKKEAPKAPATDEVPAVTKADFFAVVRDGKPYSAIQRAQLQVIYRGSSLADKKSLVEAQFSIRLAAQTPQEFTEAELDTLYNQARVLPPAHVENNPSFVRLVRSQGAGAEGTHGGDTITMDAQHDAARYAQVFRHEVGHAVDDRIGGPAADLRLNQAGWKQYAGVDEWIGALGGFGGIPAPLQAVVKRAVQAYMGAGGTFDSPTATFEETLEQAVMAANPTVRATAQDGSDAVSQTLSTLRPLLATNTLLRACVASQGSCNYFRFQSWVNNGGKVFFINHYYGRGYSVSEATHNNLKAWGDVAAAFSDKEWFAEIYADWYQAGKGGAHTAFPDFVTNFFTNVVEKLGSIDQVAQQGGGGGHPRVPR